MIFHDFSRLLMDLEWISHEIPVDVRNLLIRIKISNFQDVPDSIEKLQ